MGEIPVGMMVRRLSPADSIAELTDLLHRAYAPLAAAGMRFFATHQTEDDTRSRIAKGECYVAVLEGRLVATVTFKPPGPVHEPSQVEWYNRPDVAKLQQLGVEPALKGRGIGAVMMDLAEARALELRAAEIAIDTSERAEHLLAIYARRGYRVVGETQWEDTNYRSVVLSKALAVTAV